MVCRSPNVSPGLQMRTEISTEPQDPEDFAQVSYGFIMDNVEELRNLTATSERVFKIYADPILHPFEDGVSYFQPKNDYLTINVSSILIIRGF